MKLILDVETNGFLEKLDTIHCMVFKDIDTGKVYSYNPGQLDEGLQLLKKATLLVGHNLLGFDIPALAKVFGKKFEFNGAILDTLLCSRLIWTNRSDLDYTYKNLPPKLFGKHSLESWGYRLGLRKGDFQEHNNFDVEEATQRLNLIYQLEQKHRVNNYQSLKERHNEIKEKVETVIKFDQFIGRPGSVTVFFCRGYIGVVQLALQPTGRAELAPAGRLYLDPQIALAAATGFLFHC